MFYSPICYQLLNWKCEWKRGALSQTGTGHHTVINAEVICGYSQKISRRLSPCIMCV